MEEEEIETIWQVDEVADLKRRIKALEEMVGDLTIEVGAGKPEGLASAIDTKVSEVGGRYWSAQTGARTLILPDDNTGIQIIDDAAADVFKAIVGGTNVGDVIIGNYAGAQGAMWDKSLGTFNVKGAITATTGVIGGWSINATSIYTGTEDHSGYTANAGDLTIYSDGLDASIHAKNFYIDTAGVLNCTAAVIDGTSTIAGITGTQIGYVATSTADAVPSGLTCSSTTAVVASDGSVSSSVVLTWTAISTNTFDHYLIRYKKATNTYYTYIPSNVNTITIEGLVPNISYNFGLASVNKYGAVSVYSSDISQTTATSTTAPATVVVGSATAGIQYVIVEWTHSASTDLASYNIYRKTTDDSSTSTLIGNCRTNYFVDGGRTGGQIYYYWVKAVNTSGLLSAAYSTTVSATPRDVGDADISATAAIAATKVLIDGTIYLSNWRHTSDITKIDGGDIYTGSVTTTQLNFTPVQSTDVIASINASAEGITIEADNITIAGSTTFISEASALGVPKLFLTTPTTPYRVGDFWVDGTIFKKCITQLLTGAYNAAHWALATGYTDDTVANTKITTFAQDAIPTSISAGDMWIDTNDGNKLYRAVIAGADQIVAGEWVAVPDANKIDIAGAAADVNANATTISGGKITTNTLSADAITSSSITSKSIVLAVSGGTGDVEMRAGIATGDFANAGAANGFIFGLDDSDSDKVKFYWGNPTKNVKFDGADLTINGYAVATKGLFGGDGSDGALAITSGATNIDLAGAKVLIKNYTSISITGTGQLTFTNPHASGSMIILKSQGVVVLTSSADPNIECSGLGAAGGTAGAASGGSGGNGTTAIPLSDPGTEHRGGGGVAGGPVGAAGAIYANTGLYTINAARYTAFGRFISPGSGGGGGCGGNVGNAGGAGGRGGGALVIECAGDLNCTGNINVKGNAGEAGVVGASTDGSGGGGGSGGSCIVLYDTQTAVSGTISDAGGNGGANGGSTGGGGGAGGISGAGAAGGNDRGGGGGGGGGAASEATAGVASTSADHYIQI